MKEKHVFYAIAGGFFGWLMSLPAKAAAKRTVGGAGGHPYPPPKNHGVMFAKSPAGPVFPVGPSDNKRWGEVAYRDVNGKRHGNMSRAFKASRSGGGRNHAGIDLYADAGDIVRAPESGVLIEDQNFLNSIPGEDALLMQGDSGTVLLFGEVYADSFKEFGLEIGSRVHAGDPIARVALTNNGSHMLHFETYAKGTKKNRRWTRGQKPPEVLRDPTAYLLRAKAKI